jgi:hypothetical protein
VDINRDRGQSVNLDGILGAYVFWLLHWRTQAEKDKMGRLERVLDAYGRFHGSLPLAVSQIPEAARVYLLLCAKRGIEPEAAEPGDEKE